ncbi:uncharacterized protein LOC122638976 [Telopea speciosissima]|uniref:uncharacterized protein LOC122638976 n=1 Tax=Telopea speciosissima TaxID=54955 RepID=UPI001CC6252F|nr:uncharacterized protein LOC122638976 [Telopea speciosissima]
MEAYLKSQGYHVWKTVYTGYIIPIEEITDAAELKKYEQENKARSGLLSELTDQELARVSGCETAKQVWDKLKGIYEGDDKIKEAKLQHFRNQFESLKILPEETVEAFMIRVNEIINSIRGLGEQLKDSVVVKKILRSLPKMYNPQVLAIEESKDLSTMSLDELHGIATAYELRMVKPKTSEKEAAFKAFKKLKVKEESESEDSDDELIAYLARKFKTQKGKCKEKLPLKCLNCGGIGHFSSKSTNKGKVDDSDDEGPQMKKTSLEKKTFISRKKGNFKKKSLITHKESTASDESSDDEEYETLFVVTSSMDNKRGSEKFDDEREESEYECDLEAELYSALKDLKVQRKTVKKLQNQLNEKDEMVSQLKQIEEELTKTLDELSANLSTKEELLVLENQLKTLNNEVDDLQQKTYAEAITSPSPMTLLKSKGKEVAIQAIEKEGASTQEDDRNIVDEILSYQRPFNLKTGLRYENEGSSNTLKINEKAATSNPMKFVKGSKGNPQVQIKGLQGRQWIEMALQGSIIRDPKVHGKV